MQPLSENAINIPAFLNKLWRMVNDPETDNLISWSSAGKSFIIQNQMQFWYELLPLYYKHNNMSSFVRQLNMYGFHKMSTVENGTMDIEKDEIQFYHPYFQKDKPELLKNIKRKVTGTKVISSPTSNILKSDDLSKVLSDVKVLRGKQTSVDTQLSAMKQENAVLWRELAILRQKHMKQQQIVNKLIQFLVTIVQPTARMSGLGVKRHFPLMLNEVPQTKKKKSSTSSDGPIIHELDSVDIVPEELLVDETENAQKSSSDLLEEVCNIVPLTTDDILLDSPELVDKEGNVLVGELLDCELSPVDETTTTLAEDVNGEKVFLNPATQDTLLSNLINGGYNSDVLNSKQIKKEPATDSNLTVARIGAADYSRLNSVDDLDVHVESTQSEIDQLKDILNGYNSFDANALLGLFKDDTPEYVLSYNQNNEDITNKNDPLVSGSELATYDSGLMDFTQLFDDSSDPPDVRADTQNLDTNTSINTPQVITDVPQFPVVSRNN